MVRLARATRSKQPASFREYLLEHNQLAADGSANLSAPLGAAEVNRSLLHGPVGDEVLEFRVRL